MFTINQIKDAHAGVKSGADFPGYIQEIIKLGVTGYHSYVVDGHSVFFGSDGYQVKWDAKYAPLTINDKSDQLRFRKNLKDHQQGNTDYATFCRHCAETGVNKWVVSTVEMTCTYYDKGGEVMLVEKVPG